MIGKTNAISGVSDPVPKIRTVSGSIISISNALAMPAVSLVADINAVQDLHGYDSPWAGGAGVNKFDESSVEYGHWISASGSESTTASYGCVSDYLPASGNIGVKCFGNTPYSFSIAEYDSAKTFIRRNHFQTLSEGTVIAQSNTAYIRFQVACGGTTSYTMTPEILAGYNVVLYFGSTAPASYSPFSNICPITGWSNVNVYREAQYDAGATPYATINLNGTRYGGSLDVTTGVLTITHGIVDATTIGWTQASTQDNPNGTYYLLSNVSVPFVGWNNGGSASAKSNALVKSDTGIQTTSSANTFWWNNASTGWRAIWGIANGGSTLTEFTQFLSDNNVVFYGELATPLTVQLLPTTVQMLAGNNALWVDSGDSELQYWARR